MRAAARRAGRDAEGLVLVAVSKSASAERILQAVAAGVNDFGENYLQEAEPKIAAVAAAGARPNWHFIGHVQRNKARGVAVGFDCVQSIDSPEIAAKLAARSAAAGKALPVLLQVRLDPDPAKHGVPVEDVEAAVRQVRALDGVRLHGMMAIPQASERPEDAREAYRTLFEVWKRIAWREPAALSMGMSSDYEIAIEEGATHIRVGTAIFGARDATVAERAG
ncbi:MAG: YggS family pyridoxal phosphate-dependent enzyme [Armatimonadetes bacterium]|nr:YggS family pyridoxal phosphate-dependent enzyme [Armatimonadota bacterium]MDE2206844.1 YggS family pyridoxal phosphate-dependent enzyme [Armatimonadota bacterium]